MVSGCVAVFAKVQPKSLTLHHTIVLSDLLYPTWAHKDFLDKVCKLFCCIAVAELPSSPNVVGRANDTILGYKPPFDIPTCSFPVLCLFYR